MKKLFTMLVLLAMIGWSGVLNAQNGEVVIEEKSPSIDSSKSVSHFISMLRSNLLAPIINPDTWNYIAITKSSDLSGKLYINGVLAASNTWQNVSYSYSKLYIGASYYTSFGAFYKGFLDEFRMSNVVRTSAEIQNYYNSNQPFAVDSRTIGLWHFNETGGATFANAVSNTSAGNLYNGAAFQPGKFGNAVYFDGISSRGDCNLNIPEYNITLEFWFKYSEPQNSHIMSAYGMYNSHVTFSFSEGNPVVTCPTDMEVCQNDPVFTLTGGLPAGGSYSGDGVVSNAFFDPAIAGPGEHFIKYKYTETGFSDSCTFKITVSEAFMNDLIAQDTITACGSSYLLDSGTGFADYLWNTGATTQTISVSNTGWYKCRVSNGACYSVDSAFVSIVNALIQPNDTTICRGSSIDLSIVPNNLSPQVVRYIKFESYYSQDNGQVNVYEIEAYSGGVNVALNKSGYANSYEWGDWNSNGRSAIDGDNYSRWSSYRYDPGPDLLNPHYIVIDLQQLYDFNDPIDSVRVNITGFDHWNQDFSLLISTDDINWITIGSEQDKTGIFTYQLDNFQSVTNTYLWNTGAVTTSITVAPTETTTYYCSVSNGISACTDSVTVTVNEAFNPNLFAQDTVEVCGLSYLLDAGVGFTSYLWSTGETTQTITAVNSGLYKCTVSDGACNSVDSVFVSMVNAYIEQNDSTISAGEPIMLSATGSTIITVDGLVAYYPFNGNANDESGNGNNGTVHGAILTSDRNGNTNSAYSFTGINWIEVPHDEIINFSRNNDYSLSVWIKALPGNDGSGIIEKWDNGFDPYPYVLRYFSSSEAVQAARYLGGLPQDSTRVQIVGESIDNFNPNANIYHHLLVTFKQDKMKLYLNGIFADSSLNYMVGGDVSNNHNLYIGRRGSHSARFFIGSIDDIRIYNRALSETEITALYNEGSSSSTYSYFWSTGESTSSITVTPTETTTYYCNISNGISSCTDSVTVTVIPSSGAICPNNFEVCQNAPAFTLTGGLPAGGSYSGDGVVSGTSFDPGTAGLGEHLITYSHTDQYGFTGQCTFTITVLPFANVDLGNDQTICETDVAYLTANTSNCTNLLWTTNGDGTFSSTSSLTPVYTPGTGDIVNGTVEVCLTATTNVTCIETLSDCKNLVIIHLPEVEAGNDASICFNQVFETASVTNNAAEVLWLTSGDGFFANETEPNTAYYPGTGDIATGQIELCLYVLGINPCIAQYSDCLTLDIFVTPEAEAGADATICTGETYQLTGTAENYGNINWTTGGDGTFSSISSLTPVYTPGISDISAGAVNLCLEVTGEGGCSTAQVNSCMTLMIFDLPVISGLDTQKILGCGDYDFASKEWLPVAISVQLTDYTSFEWSTDGDGYFDDPTQLNVNYHPGFNDSWQGGANLCIDVYGNNTCQLTSSACMELVLPNQIVTISDAGWDGISSYLEMSTASVPEVMAPIENELIIMINKQGKYYWPEPNPPINQIGNWSATGYKARFNAGACLPMYGDPLINQSFLISGAFTYLPVLTNVPSLITDVLGANKLKVLMIYDWLTTEVWTNVAADFQYLQPGKAYLLVSKTASASYTITFPDFDPEQPIVSTINGPVNALRNNSPWNNVTNTLQPHAIMFSPEATGELQSGDIIGAFDNMENCVGMAEFGNRESFFKLIAMGDDPSTDEIDGFPENELMKFRLYRKTTGETFAISLTWNQEYPDSEGYYAINGVSMAETMTMNITSVNSVDPENNIRVLPNPVKDVLNVVSDIEIRGITLVNNVGQKMLSRAENSSRFQINVSNYPPGLYFLKIETKSGTMITRSVSIQ